MIARYVRYLDLLCPYQKKTLSEMDPTGSAHALDLIAH